MSNYYQWRAYIGPRFGDMDSSYWFDWTALSSGHGNYPDTTLSTTMTDGAQNAVCASAGSWPGAGGYFVGPNGSGQAWEYCNYLNRSSNTLIGGVSTREPSTSREHNGVHTAGAPIRFWWPLTTNDGTLHLTEEMDENLASISWRATISGIAMPQVALRTYHLIIVETRPDATSSWTALLVGWLDTPTVREDSTRASAWTANIISAAEMAKRQQTTGVRVGDLDMAKHGSASSSTPLANAYKERISGDYVAANPSFDAGMAIDDEIGTVWITERYIGDDNTPTTTSDPTNPDHDNTEFIISQIYINPFPGQSGGRRWVELTCISDTDVSGWQLITAAGGSSTDYEDVHLGGIGQGDHVIVCEDEDVFTEEHPECNALRIYQNAEFFSAIDPASGVMAMRSGLAWKSHVRWGDGTRTFPDVDGSAPGFWVGPRMPSPGYGETMRYMYNYAGAGTNSKDWWDVSNVESAGYTIDTSPDQWIQVELEPMGLKLTNDITASVPGSSGKMYLSDASGASTAGLPDSGEGQIGSEQFSWTSKEADGLIIASRGINSTTAASHAAEDQIFILDWDGVATDAAPIKRVGWSRSGGTIYPKNFHVFASNLPANARVPGSGEAYQVDYELLHSETAYASSSWGMDLSPSRRIRWLLIGISRMTANPGRARLNDIQALADPSKYGFGVWLDSPQYVGTIMTAILNSVNIPNSAISVTDTITAPLSVQTEVGDAWSILTDFADYTGFRIDCSRLSHFTISRATGNFFGAASHTTTSTTWTRITAAAIEYVWATPGDVNQVVLEWETYDGSANGKASYPANPDMFGKKSEIEKSIYADQAAAQNAAMHKYIMSKYPNTLHVDCADALPTLRPGTIHLLQIKVDNTMQAMNRYFIAKSVDHVIEKGVWSTSVEDVQIDLEREY